MKVFEAFRLAQPLFNGGVIGFEMEVEGMNLPSSIKGSFWSAKKDGSLRGEALEYVLRKPVMPDVFEKALSILNKQLNTEDTKLDFSFRTSNHVHVNVSDMEIPHLLNMIYIYFLVEDMFIKYAGDSRKGNRFCLRMRDAEGIVDTVLRTFTDNIPARIMRLKMDEVKYAAINLAAISSYSSLEFRALRGTNDPEIILPWVKALANLRDVAMSFDGIYSVYQYITTNDNLLQLIDNIFGEHVNLFKYNGFEQDIQYNSSLTISLPHVLKHNIVREVVPVEIPVEVDKNSWMNVKLPEGFQEMVNAAWADGVRLDIDPRRPQPYRPRMILDAIVEDDVNNLENLIDNEEYHEDVDDVRPDF